MNDIPQRWRYRIRGAVQGVGFRPFVFRLATEEALVGWVENSPAGVTIEVEGESHAQERFRCRLQTELPPNARLLELERSPLEPVGFDEFQIRESDLAGAPTALVLADLATCEECRAEIFDPANRRYRYPFTNCTHCGPRFSIIEALPYDRANTSMASFAMCPECRGEYADPHDRRFHAQPNACPVCGPWLSLWDSSGRELAAKDQALGAAAEALGDGRIVAVKGLGGFHLMVDATNADAVRRLRERKRRSEKPFAVMFPSLNAVREACHLSDGEAVLLQSPQAPIVLLDRDGNAVSREVAPGNPTIGAMLPYTPLHHLLLKDLGIALVATSANISEEPICIDEREALRRLRGIADLLLVHNRPVLRPVEDSVVRFVSGRMMILRRSRGYAPMPVGVPVDCSGVMGLGGHLKNSIALGVGNQIMTGPHGGDLENVESFGAFKRCVEDFQALYATAEPCFAIDRHPDYMASRFGRACSRPSVEVQHHFAHVASCMAENGLRGRALGVSWDGTGYGLDGTVWGGEFLLADERHFERVAHLRPFSLPGGEVAVREPRRCALGVLYEIYGDLVFEKPGFQRFLGGFEEPERKVLRQALERGVNAPRTTSAGRLFDAVASLAGLRQRASYEGQGAMEVEFAARAFGPAPAYPTDQLNWGPMVEALIQDLSAGEIAARFHQTLVEIIAGVAKMVGEERVVLTGGCFQNRTLLEGVIERLRRDGFSPYWHQFVPPNDGGLAVGQVFIAAARKERRDGDVSRGSGEGS